MKTLNLVAADWPPLIKMDAAVKAKVEKLFSSSSG